MIFLDAGDDVGIEVLRFGAVADMKDLFAVTGFDECLAFATGKERKHRHYAEKKNDSAQRGGAEIKLHCVFRQLTNVILQKKQPGNSPLSPMNFIFLGLRLGLDSDNEPRRC